jgi:curved DNA-binding protein CbpA
MAPNKDKFFTLNYTASAEEANKLLCSHQDCTQPGEHRAPKSRETLHDYLYFCTKHIANYNANWNYYKGMSPEQVARENDIDLTWRRPRHLFGTRYKDQKKYWQTNPYDLFSQESANTPISDIPETVHQALRRFELNYPFTSTELKKRYRLLAKKYHPDTSSDAQTTDQFFKVLKDYQLLRGYAL